MLTDEEIALGGYRYEDLLALRIVTNRTDLDRKQAELNFPKPVKTGKSQAWFPKAEVNAWLRMRAALRDAPSVVPEPPAVEIPKRIAATKASTMENPQAKRAAVR